MGNVWANTGHAATFLRAQHHPAGRARIISIYLWTALGSHLSHRAVQKTLLVAGSSSDRIHVPTILMAVVTRIIGKILVGAGFLWPSLVTRVTGTVSAMIILRLNYDTDSLIAAMSGWFVSSPLPTRQCWARWCRGEAGSSGHLNGLPASNLAHGAVRVAAAVGSARGLAGGARRG